MEDKKRRAYIIGQTKGFDAKERFETAEKFSEDLDLRFSIPKALRDIYRASQKTMKKLKTSSCGISKSVTLHICWMGMNRVRRLQEHTERQESEVLIWHMSRKEYKNA